MQSSMKILYLIRFVVCYLTMEYVLHFIYVVAIKDTKSWIGDSPAQIAMIGFWNLIVVWLKVRCIFIYSYHFNIPFSWTMCTFYVKDPPNLGTRTCHAARWPSPTSSSISRFANAKRNNIASAAIRSTRRPSLEQLRFLHFPQSNLIQKNTWDTSTSTMFIAQSRDMKKKIQSVRVLGPNWRKANASLHHDWVSFLEFFFTKFW